MSGGNGNSTTSGSADRARRAHMMLHDAETYLRDDAALGDDPQARALFETAAEVLRGLMKALEDYQRASEPAWRR
jgi:hypothetical protein